MKHRIGFGNEPTGRNRKGRSLVAKHSFGILQQNPPLHRRYDEYEPEKYGCIDVDDALIEPLLPALQEMDCFWHTLRQPGKGLAYTGITLIPPASLPLFRRLLRKAEQEELAELLRPADKAQAENHYLLHFGI